MQEIWKEILGSNGQYEASSLGRVRSIKSCGVRNLVGGRSHAYRVFKITINGRHTSMQAGRAVYLAFHGAIPNGMQIDHIDNNPENNAPDNLRAVSPMENISKSWDLRRANGRTAMHTVGNHCKRGHEFTSENTHYAKDGYRYCKACAHFRYMQKKESA